MKKLSVCLTVLLLLWQYAPVYGVTPARQPTDSVKVEAKAEHESSIAQSTAELADGTIYCPKCGAANSADARYCASCGALLQTQQSQPPIIIREEHKGTSAWEVVGIIAAAGCAVCLVLYLIGLASY